MKFKKLLWLLIVLLALPFTLKLKGQDFGQHQSLFTDIKAHMVGDILTVLVSEQNRASNQVTTKTQKSTKAEASGGPGIGVLSFKLFDADIENKVTFNGKGDNSRNNSLTAKISVTVVALKPNGDLVIQGSRIIGISNDKEIITLTGVVRQKDVTPDNTISSYLIADAQISYTGKGTASSAARPGLITRILNFLF